MDKEKLYLEAAIEAAHRRIDLSKPINEHIYTDEFIEASATLWETLLWLKLRYKTFLEFLAR